MKKTAGHLAWGGAKLVELIPIVGCSFAAAVGYLMNEFVLSRIYNFKSFKGMRYQYFRFGTLEELLCSYLETMGYASDKHIFSLEGIGNMLACLFSVMLIYAAGKLCCNLKKCKKTEQIVVLFAVFSFSISIFVYFVTWQVASRYVMVCVAPAILLILFWENFPQNKQHSFILALWGAIFILGAKEYWNIAQMDQNEDKRNMIAYITDHGYTYGYATFWNANIVTELTNGKIAFRNLYYDGNTGEITKHDWLTPVSAKDYQEPVIGVFRRSELETVDLQEELKAIYEDEEYIVYEFASEAEIDRVFGF